MSDAATRTADVGDAIGIQTKDNVIYMGEVVEYDHQSYAPPGCDLIFAAEIESAHRMAADGLEAAPDEIPTGEPPDKIDAPDGLFDGVVSVFDFEGRYVLLEWSAGFREGDMRFAPRASTVVGRVVSGDIMIPERVLPAAESTTERDPDKVADFGGEA